LANKNLVFTLFAKNQRAQGMRAIGQQRAHSKAAEAAPHSTTQASNGREITATFWSAALPLPLFDAAGKTPVSLHSFELHENGSSSPFPILHNSITPPNRVIRGLPFSILV